MTATTNDPSLLSVIAQVTATRCCVCGLRLRDAESIEHGIGPVCSKRYYNPLHTPTEEQIRRALGHLAVSNLPDHLVDACLAFSDKGDARRLSNLLIYYASARYDEREEVLKCSAIIRALGYVELANKLEQDRTTALIQDTGEHLEVYLPSQWSVQAEVRKIPGATELWCEVPDEYANAPLIGDAPATPVMKQARAWRGKKEGWKIPKSGLPHLECILGVFFHGDLVSYGNSNLQKIPRRRRVELLQYTQAPVVSTAAKESCSVAVRSDGKLEVHTEYKAGFIADLKRLPYRDRRWDPKKRCWEVAVRHQAEVYRLIRQHYNVTLDL